MANSETLRLTDAERNAILRQREQEAAERNWTKSGTLKPGYLKCGGCGGNGSIDYSEDEFGSDKDTCQTCNGSGQLSPSRISKLTQAFVAGLNADAEDDE